METVAHHDPRELPSVALHDVRSMARLRLIFLGTHRLHGVGRFVPGTGSTVTAQVPTGVVHSGLGDVTSALGGDGFVLRAGESALVDFAGTLDLPAGLDWFLEVTGEHITATASGAAAYRRGPEGGEAPLRFALAQNRPNPFDSNTQIGFDLPVRALVRLEVFDLLGRRVATLANTSYEPGRHSVSWDRRGNMGARVPAGVYTCRYIAGDHREQRRMIVFP